MALPRPVIDRDLQDLREALLRLAGQVESQIERATFAMRHLDEPSARELQRDDRLINEAQGLLRERCFAVIATQRPDDRALRLLISIQYICVELERMGDYAVRIARRTCLLAQLPRRQPLRAEFGLMGEFATQQVRDILDALIETDPERARAVAAQDSQIDPPLRARLRRRRGRAGHGKPRRVRLGTRCCGQSRCCRSRTTWNASAIA